MWCRVYVHVVFYTSSVVYMLYRWYDVHAALCTCCADGSMYMWYCGIVHMWYCVIVLRGLCSHCIMTCIFFVLYSVYVYVLCCTLGVGVCIVLWCTLGVGVCIVWCHTLCLDVYM